MSRKGQSRNNSGVADDDWDVTEADSLSDPLTEWDFGNLDVAETAPRRTGAGADRYSMEDQHAADNELAGEHSWETEFGTHPGPSNQGNGQRMNPRVAQPPVPQSRVQQPMASYQQFPPSSSTPPMMAYPGSERTGRQTTSQPIQGRPQVHSGAPMGQQPGMRPAYPSQVQSQPQPQQRPMYPSGSYTQMPMQPQQRPMGQMPPQQRPMGQMPMQPQHQQRPMGQMMPPQGQPRPNQQMGRGRSGSFLPQSEFNNGTYHRAQGY